MPCTALSARPELMRSYVAARGRFVVLTILPSSGALALALAVFAACASAHAQEHVAPRSEYAPVATALTEFIERERTQKVLGAVSIALVDGDEIVWATGFGEADADGSPATARTVYRVGSVSKLFTDIAVMQLAERGELDIDAPVTAYVPGFAPGGVGLGENDGEEGPDDGGTGEPRITLRQLMSHRSGLVREPPVGNYFDDTGPTLAATVASLNDVRLVHEPGTHTKYSNAGIAVVGYALEITQGEPFADYVGRAVLDPLAMTESAFTPEPHIVDRLADARMWAHDRADWDAPTFELGMAPAGSMYSTVLDLARFISAMFRGGEGESGRILSSSTLERMWTPQFADAEATTGYGLGFAVGELGDERKIGHGGAIYGFSTQLSFLPDAGLGVVAISAVDITNSFTGRIADAALQMMMAVQAGEELPEAGLRPTVPIDPSVARDLAGIYGPDETGIELEERGGRIFGTALRGGFTAELRGRGDTLVIDDRLAVGGRFVPDGDGLLVLGASGTEPVRLARRQPSGLPATARVEWLGLIGEYGWDHNVLYVLERHGRLHALIEWFFLYPLSREAPGVYSFPDWGLYPGERLVFERGSDGRALSVEVGDVDFARREVGTVGGETFRIDPVRPVAELIKEALAASPPEESGPFRDPELVEVVSLEPGIKLDVRYATTNNFMSSVFYDEPRIFLQLPAAEAVVRAHHALADHGYGLILYDGYRPWYVTKTFWDATPESQKLFVANPASGSRHNRGSAIDLSLYDLATGEPVEMTGGYDEFSPRSFPAYPGGTSRQRWLRALLRRTMEDEGFTVYEAEWWHFDHESWREYAIGNATFGELGR